MLHFVIHTEKYKDAKEAARLIFNDIKMTFPTVESKSYYDDAYLRVGPDITFDIRCGKDPSKMAGMRMDFYYSDNEDVAEFLELSACKTGGRRIKDIASVTMIIGLYFRFKARADRVVDMDWED